MRISSTEYGGESKCVAMMTISMHMPMLTRVTSTYMSTFTKQSTSTDISAAISVRII